MAFDYTGSFSGSFFGDITASNGVVSSSAQVIANLPAGSLSGSSQVSYNSIQNRPTTITNFQKNSITAVLMTQVFQGDPNLHKEFYDFIYPNM